jgi:hypothetical protein
MRNRSLRETIPGDPPGTALTLMLLGTSLCLSVGQVTTGPVAAAATAQATPAPSIRGLKLGAPSVACYDCLEVSCAISGNFENPFDPREIQVDGHFHGPNGKQVVMPANADHTFAALLEKRLVTPIENARVTVRDIPPGTCQVEWWDTASGQLTRTATEQATENGLTLDLLAVATDVACRIRWPCTARQERPR